MEKILRIEESTFKNPSGGYGYYDGYNIITDTQTIQIGINNGQSCCEQFGCIITNDDTEDFIGADLLGVSLTDTSLNNQALEEIVTSETGTMFVNLETNVGLLQFVAYNTHNGYYGHEAVLVSRQITHTENL